MQKVPSRPSECQTKKSPRFLRRLLMYPNQAAPMAPPLGELAKIGSEGQIFD